MTLLTIIQDATQDLGLAEPTSVVGNNDKKIVQLLQLANREGRNLASRYNWSSLIKQVTFTQVAAQLQGVIQGGIISAGDFESIVNDSMWNRTTQLPVPGPLGSQDWQALQAFPLTGPYRQFRIQEGKLFFDPAGANASDTIAFEYNSKSFCASAAGAGKSKWSVDTDVGILDEDLMTLGIIWRWLQRKGLDYAEDFNAYETRVANAMARDGGKATLQLNSNQHDRIPGIFVPQGSWSPN
jgi:hypothetical protein|tara:strand:- start:372 stop:1091 length:720 start_codon:yes stop_codon:yes gene_type:complete